MLLTLSSIMVFIPKTKNKFVPVVSSHDHARDLKEDLKKTGFCDDQRSGYG